MNQLINVLAREARDMVTLDGLENLALNLQLAMRSSIFLYDWTIIEFQ
jgi:hypothetical protein